MTDFRQVWRLHAYSGGTVRDSHPVFYSLAVLLPHPQALKRNIYLRIYDTIVPVKSQSVYRNKLVTVQAMHLYLQNAKPLIPAAAEISGFVLVEAPAPSPGKHKVFRITGLF